MTIVSEPEPVTDPLVTSIVSKVVSSDVSLMVILPLSTSTISLKTNVMSESTATDTAPFEGVDDFKVGMALSAEVKLNS
eukprot:CAMPEP_0201283398 /NCGR_PEP_ID=MMETSP1317-20130820/8456_1 /ASSEMBLY_ACC=CAM_ASM_000770 /TAXON_ID=187299 /ORGANISM="Undescribed Undescribed, Strain Undescribed" /LENGTH=78 /DNA_ID=CAMNT_0047599517 /DNA_START=191 /DNA_END=424 /DNA_ORIENTATION=-